MWCLCSLLTFIKKSMVNIWTEPSALYQLIMLILVRLFVYAILLIALNRCALVALQAKRIVLMASVVIHALLVWHQLVLALVLLKFKFLCMLVWRGNVLIFQTLLPPTSLNKVLKPVPLISVCRPQLLHGMGPTLQTSCGVNAQHLTMVNWTIMNQHSLPCMRSMAPALLCLSFGCCINVFAKR